MVTPGDGARCRSPCLVAVHGTGACWCLLRLVAARVKLFCYCMPYLVAVYGAGAPLATARLVDALVAVFCLRSSVWWCLRLQSRAPAGAYPSW